MAASVYSRAVQKAIELVGGRERLARRLRVPKGDIERWIADEIRPPRDIFLRIVDLILDESAPSQELEQDLDLGRAGIGKQGHRHR